MKVGVDLFDKPIKNHLAYATLRDRRARLGCSRLVLTHMSADMLGRRDETDETCADDGMSISL